MIRLAPARRNIPNAQRPRGRARADRRGAQALLYPQREGAPLQERADRDGDRLSGDGGGVLRRRPLRVLKSRAAGNDVRSRRRELKEALERETATAGILQIIASSPADTQPVFDAIVRAGLKLFPGALVSVALRYGDKINAAAVAAPDPARVEAWRLQFLVPLSARSYMHGAALLDRRIVDIPDVANARRNLSPGAKLPDQRQPRDYDHAHDARR